MPSRYAEKNNWHKIYFINFYSFLFKLRFCDKYQQVTVCAEMFKFLEVTRASFICVCLKYINFISRDYVFHYAVFKSLTHNKENIFNSVDPKHKW